MLLRKRYCRQTPMKPPRKQQGAALIFAILVSVLMGVFAAFFTYKAKQTVAFAERVGDQLEARHISSNKVDEAVYALSSLNYQKLVWPTTNETLPNAYWGYLHSIDNNTIVGFQDVAARLNLIPFRTEEWVNILILNGIERTTAIAIADRIQDWMDTDDFRRVQGMEKRNYQFINSNVSPRNYIMQNLSELLYIPGISKEIYALIVREASYWGTMERSPLNGSDAMIESYGGPVLLEAVKQNRSVLGGVGQLYNSMPNVDASLVNRLLSGIFRVTIKIRHQGAEFERVVEVNMRGNDVMPHYVIEWK